jgi:hypothetical protein
MNKNQIKFRAKLWKYQGKAAWYFINLPEDESLQIKYHNILRIRGWGSLPVNVQIGETKWKTSIFPDGKRGCYILPVKSEVRKNEKLKEGSAVEVRLEVI